MLLMNDEAGAIIDWSTRITHPEDWFWSIKDDGVRVEMMSGDSPGLSRALKPIRSIWVQALVKHFQKCYNWNGVVEAEIYAPGMNLSEIAHFVNTVNVEDPKYKKKWDLEWKKTAQGTSTYKKTVKGKVVDQPWLFPGRTPEWLCTWHKELHLQIFGCFPFTQPLATMEERYILLNSVGIKDDDTKPWKVVKQNKLKSLEEMEGQFEAAQLLDREGLVLMHREGQYKQGRISSVKQALDIGFKYKETNIEFVCVVLDVVEADMATPDAPRFTNELGRTVTSKLAEHRMPSGLAKGFLVLLEDGQQMTVSLNGYDHPLRKKLLENKQATKGAVLTCTGMKPVKVGGKPRSAHYTRGYVPKAER